MYVRVHYMGKTYFRTFLNGVNIGVYLLNNNG